MTERQQFKFTIILEHKLKRIIPEYAHRRLLRLELCKIFVKDDAKNPIEALNSRAKSGKEPTYSQMIAMKKALAKYGIKEDEIFDKE